MCPSRSHQSLCVRAEKSLQERVCKAFQSKSLRSSHRGEGGAFYPEPQAGYGSGRGGEIGHIAHMHPPTHTHSHQALSFFFLCLCLRHLVLFLHHVLKQLHGSHHGFILQGGKMSNQGTMMQFSHVL